LRGGHDTRRSCQLPCLHHAALRSYPEQP